MERRIFGKIGCILLTMGDRQTSVTEEVLCTRCVGTAEDLPGKRVWCSVVPTDAGPLRLKSSAGREPVEHLRGRIEDCEKRRT